MASSRLDPGQVLKNAFDDASGALKTIPASATTFEMELDHADGDSVLTYDGQVSAQALTVNNTVSSVVIAEFDVSIIKNVQIFTKTTATITGPQLLTLQISPIDSGDFWVNTSVTTTPSTTLNNTSVSSNVSVSAKRARLITAAAITSGSYDVVVIGN